jgi:DNA primase
MDFTRDQTKEEIRNRLDIVQVVGRYVALKPAGHNMKGLCPFHKEKSPSFMVNAEKGIFHCFGCGKGGDVFTFLMEIEGIDFKEALTMTAEETGVKLETYRERPAPSGPAGSGGGELSKTELLRIHELAGRFFYEQMKKSPVAIDYLKGRGLTGQTVKEFGLGYAPGGWSHLVDFARTHRISNAALLACGLAATKNEGGSVYDRFRNRIMFPLFDMTGKVIAFAGRTLDKETMPKYVNSPETPLYHKSKTLYGLHKARPAVKEAGGILIVEGYLDFLTLYQAGIRHAVATSGTALTVEHGHIIERFTNRVTLLFDGDSAGVSAAERGVFVLAPLNLDVRVCLLPPEHDPDSFVLENGPDALRDMLDKAQPGITFMLEHAIRRHGLASAQSKSAVVRQLLPLLAAITDAIVVADAVKTLAERLGLAERVIYGEIRKEKPQAAVPQAGPPGGKAWYGTQEAKLLTLLLQHPELVEIAMERISPETLNDEFSMNLYSIILDTYAVDPTLKTVLDHAADQEVGRALSALALSERSIWESWKDELHHTIRRLQVKAMKNQLRLIRLQQKSVRDTAEMKSLQEEHMRIAKELQELDGGWTRKTETH